MMIIISYLVIINTIGFLTMGIDKRKSIFRKKRIREKTIWTISLIGGNLGTILGMFIFHHKTKHIKFLIGLPIIFFIWLIFLSYFIIP